MSVTGFVLAFAGALAAKVRPAPLEPGRLEAMRLKAELEATRVELETTRGELEATREALGQARRERAALTAALERAWRERDRAGLAALQSPAFALQNAVAQYQAQQASCAQQAQWAQMQAQQNVYNLGVAQGLGSLGLAGPHPLAQAQGAWHDCTCVPGRAAALRGD